jgi:signal transduction histidine kinase
MNGKLQLTFTDTGIGISDEYRQRMFQVFSQESEGMEKDYQGIGLGLALTKRYLDMNHVKIGVDSEKGSGSTFTLIFPNHSGK